MTVTISAHPCATNTLTAAQEVERRGCVDDRVELAGNTPRGGQRQRAFIALDTVPGLIASITKGTKVQLRTSRQLSSGILDEIDGISDVTIAGTSISMQLLWAPALTIGLIGYWRRRTTR